MEESLPRLKVYMLGGFSAAYGEVPVTFGRNNVTKAMKLLQILIYNGEKGITREKLLEELYGREEHADVANSFRVTMHRLKKMLSETELPEYNYVVAQKGIYYWNAPMKTEIDAVMFESLLDKADVARDEKTRIHFLKEACQMYKGGFLPELSGEEWVLLENLRYKNKYSEALRELCGLLVAEKKYEEALQFCNTACKLYPFDEWQEVRIECFVGLGHYKEAMKEYETTAKMFFEELGVGPSEKMLNQFEIMSRQMNYTPHEIKNIKDRLEETGEREGAYYCTLPSFRDSYRIVARIVERNGQSVFLMQCSITDGKSQPMDNEKKLELLSGELGNSIRHCLRRGDSFTKYSPSQFLILLVGINEENCSIVFDRIRKYFSREHKGWEQYLECVVSPVADVNREGAAIQF